MENGGGNVKMKKKLETQINEQLLMQNIKKSSEEQPVKSFSCNCKKSKCLKLYCDCFSINRFCGPSCNCENCANTSENNELRKQAMISRIENNPNAFLPKFGKENVKKNKKLIIF